MKVEISVEEIKALMEIKTPSARTLDVITENVIELLKSKSNILLDVNSSHLNSVLNNHHSDKAPDQ